MKTVLVTCWVEMYCRVEVPEETPDDEAIALAKKDGEWFRTMNWPAKDYAVTKDGK